MNTLSVDSLASATKSNRQRERGGRTFFKALLVGALLTGALAAGPADAGLGLTITTTGTIQPGTGFETGGLFGGATDFDNLPYTLTVHFDDLGPNYTTNGSGTSASDLEFPPLMTGSVTAVVNGQSLTTPLTSSFGSALIETLFVFNASNVGVDNAGDFVNVTQSLTCPGGCVPYADLMTPFLYTLGSSDSGSADTYFFQGITGTSSAGFTGTEAKFSFSVPEPASLLLLATGLLGLGMPSRRRQA